MIRVSVTPTTAGVAGIIAAGKKDDARLWVELFIGGWDGAARQHVARSVLKQEVKGEPYDVTWHVKETRLPGYRPH